MPPVFISQRPWQRQMQQPLVERAPQREHDPYVEDALPVVLESPPMCERMTTVRKTRPVRLRRVRRAWLSRSLFRITWSTMYRMNSGSIICRPATTRASTTPRERGAVAAAANAGSPAGIRAGHPSIRAGASASDTWSRRRCL